MVKKIIILLLISSASCTAPSKVSEENKQSKYRIVAHKANGTSITSKTER